jgi:hypothetical protein
VYALNKKGDVYEWNTNVLTSAMDMERRDFEELIKEKVLITMGDISTLTWNIAKSIYR